MCDTEHLAVPAAKLHKHDSNSTLNLPLRDSVEVQDESDSVQVIQNNLMAQAYNDLAPDEELNCIAITQYCFKCGRITVPPPIALAMAGLGEHGKENHKIFEKLVKQRKIKEYMKGGYKDSAFADVEFNINDLEVINAQRVAPYKVFNESLSAFKTH